jgi:hypothetical protein
MTNTYAPILTPQQILNSIHYWIDQDTWAPGIAFDSGPQLPEIDQTPEADDPHEGDFFFLTTNQHLHQLKVIDEELEWDDLGTSANSITWCGTTVPGSGEGVNLQLFNKYDSGEIYQKIEGTWRNIGSNKNGLPLSAGALNFTDTSKTWRSANLGLLLVDEGFSPILATDQGFVAKKDISAGGFIGTNQGEVWIGHGRENATDVPKIILDHAGIGYATLYLRQRLWDSQIGDWTVTTPGHLDLGDFTVHGDLSIEGYTQFNSDAKLVWVNTSTLAVQDEDGVTANGALDAGSIYTNNLQPLNSGSPAGININCPLNIGGTRGTSGQILTSNGSGSTPTWQTAPAWNGGTVSNDICIAQGSSTYLHGVKGLSVNSNQGYSGISISDNNYDFLWWANSGSLRLYVSGASHGSGADIWSFDTIGNLSVVGAGEVGLNLTGGTTAANKWRIFSRTADDQLGIYSYSAGQTFLRLKGETGVVECDVPFTCATIRSYSGNLFIDTLPSYNVVIRTSGGTWTAYFNENADMYLSGTGYFGNDIYIGGSVANDCHLHRANAGILSILDANDNLGTLNVSNIKADHWTAATGSEMYFMNHMRAYSALNIMPNANNSGNIGGNGAGTNYYWGAVYANYLMYHTNHTAFDQLNDLDLVKGYRTKTDETGKIVIDDASLPFLRDTEGFFRPDRVNGFLLGCAKATAIKHDEQDNRVNALLTRVETLENQLQTAQKQD